MHCSFVVVVVGVVVVGDVCRRRRRFLLRVNCENPPQTEKVVQKSSVDQLRPHLHTASTAVWVSGYGRKKFSYIVVNIVMLLMDGYGTE